MGGLSYERLRSRLPSGEQGQTLPLIIGFGIGIILLCSVVFDVSQAFVYRRALHAIADGAALAATNGINEAQIYQSGVQDRVVISSRLAQAEVQQYLAAGDYQSVTCNADVVGGGTEVTVTCRGFATLPIANTLTNGQGRIPIQVQASAETFARP